MSDLLNSASLVMIPSGYKEDVVYCQIPTDGSGDLSFTRASNGTRVNSAGLVEVCPWNLITYSEEFNNGSKALVNATIGVDVTTAPNGTTTADSLIENGANDLHAVYNFSALTYVAGVYSLSCYVKKGVRDWVRVQLYDGTNTPSVWANVNTGVLGTISSGATASIESVGNGWYRINVSYSMISALGGWAIYSSTADAQFAGYQGTNGATALYLWGLQLNIGSTAKPYFPTTDRLNVPRLTYQNGGGGCPSLLLEKQSTNLYLYSQELNQWTTSGSVTVTANDATSPDGTTNADRVQFSASGDLVYISGTGSAGTNVVSVYAKAKSGTAQKFRFFVNGATLYSSDFTATDQWQRFEFSYTFSNQTAGLGGATTGASDVLFWGFQHEVSSYATSYIPTTSSSATRVADACYKTGISSLIGQTEGTIFFDGVINGAENPTTNIINSEKNVTCSFYMQRRKSSSQIGIGFIFGGSTTAELLGGSIAIGQRVKAAWAYKSGSNALSINGVIVATSTTTYTIPSTFNDIFLNDPTTYFSYQEAVQFNQVALFKTRLTNAELASLTTI